MWPTPWPTPTVCGNYNHKGASANSGDGLATAVAVKYPTPKSRDWKDTGSVPPSRLLDPGKDTLGQHLSRTEPGRALNPDWVEWLMNWPIGWTGPAPINTAGWLAATLTGAWWEEDPANDGLLTRTGKEIKNRTARLKAIGNGQVPLCAATAWQELERRLFET